MKKVLVSLLCLSGLFLSSCDLKDQLFGSNDSLPDLEPPITDNRPSIPDNPEPEKPNPEPEKPNPEPEKPGPENPEPDKPNPEPEKPGPDNHEPENPEPEIEEFDVIINHNNSLGTEQLKVKKGDKITLKEEIEPFKFFVSWYDQNGYEVSGEITIEEDSVFTAKYDDTVKINFDSQGGSDISSGELKYEVQNKLPVPSMSNGEFLGWYYFDEDNNEQQLTDETFSKFTKDLDVKAKWLVKNDSFTYLIENDEAKVKEINVLSTSMKVLDDINGIPVTTIMSNFNEGTQFIDSFIFGKNIKKFEKNAFVDNTHIEYMFYDGNVMDWCHINFENENALPHTISTHVNFKNGSKYEPLKEIIIPKDIDTIGFGQFAEFNGIKKVVIPDNITKIDTLAFFSMDDLQCVIMSKNIKQFGRLSFFKEFEEDRDDLRIFYAKKDCNFEEDHNYEFENNRYKNKYESVRTFMHYDVPYTKLELYDDAKYSYILADDKYAYDFDFKDKNCTEFDFSKVFEGTNKVLKSINANALVNTEITSVIFPKNMDMMTTHLFFSYDFDKYPFKVNSIKYKGTLRDWLIEEHQLLNYIKDFDFYLLKDNSNEYYKPVDIVIPGDIKNMPRFNLPNIKSINSIVVEEGITSIGDDAFTGCTNLKSLSLPSTLETIGGNVLIDTGLEEIKYNGDINGWLNIFMNALDLNNQYYFYFKNKNDEYELVKDILLPEGTTRIPSDTFVTFKGINSIVIPSSVTEIGRFLSNEQNVKLKYNGNLEQWLNVKKSEDISSSGLHLYLLNSLNEYELVYDLDLSNVKNVPDYSFNGIILNSVKLPKDTSLIGREAFNYGQGYYLNSKNEVFSIYYDGTLNDWLANEHNYKAFPMNTDLYLLENKEYKLCRDLVLPNDLIEINNHAFQRINLDSIIFNDGLKRIGDYAFDDSKIRRYYLPDSVEYFGKNIFPYKTDYIRIPSSLKVLTKDFYHQIYGMTAIYLPNGIETIETNALCLDIIKRVYLSKSIKKIDSQALNDDVLYFYEGSQEEFDKINIDYQLKQKMLKNIKFNYVVNSVESYYDFPNEYYVIDDKYIDLVYLNYIDGIKTLNLDKFNNKEVVIINESSISLYDFDKIIMPGEHCKVDKNIFRDSAFKKEIYLTTDVVPQTWDPDWNNSYSTVYKLNEWKFDENGEPVPLVQK